MSHRHTGIWDKRSEGVPKISLVAPCVNKQAYWQNTHTHSTYLLKTYEQKATRKVAIHAHKSNTFSYRHRPTSEDQNGGITVFGKNTQHRPLNLL